MAEQDALRDAVRDLAATVLMPYLILFSMLMYTTNPFLKGKRVRIDRKSIRGEPGIMIPIVASVYPALRICDRVLNDY